MMHEFYGDEAGARIARKHMQAYLQRWGAAELTPSFMPLIDGAAQRQWLCTHRESLLGIAQSVAACKWARKHRSPPDAACKEKICR